MLWEVTAIKKSLHLSKQLILVERLRYMPTLICSIDNRRSRNYNLCSSKQVIKYFALISLHFTSCGFILHRAKYVYLRDTANTSFRRCFHYFCISVVFCCNIKISILSFVRFLSIYKTTTPDVNDKNCNTLCV